MRGIKYNVFTFKKLNCAFFNTSTQLNTVTPKNIKGKSKSSQEWLARQLSDPYVKKSRFHNFRCRSAFKLLEINEKYKILNPGNIVVDCGAAPGSWSQVAATQTNSNKQIKNIPVGKVIGIDKLNVHPVEGVTFFSQCDITLPETHQKILHELEGEKVDVVLSDMAPNTSGNKELDHDYLTEMGYCVLRFAALNTKIGGTFLIKLWSGRNTNEFEFNLKQFYTYVKYVKPDASRSDSAELYFLARNFKGIKENIS